VGFDQPTDPAPTSDGKLIPIIGVINHLTHVEWRWIDGSYAHKEPVWRTEEEFVVGTERTLAEVVDAYAARAEATDRTVREAPGLDGSLHPARGAPRRRPPLGTRPSHRGDRTPRGPRRRDARDARRTPVRLVTSATPLTLTPPSTTG
jgi:hypothetical protein